MQPLVSVIVPVYKVDNYLVRCLDSLCRQSLKDIEILLIDDASPDRCGEICEKYAAQDRRFKVIHHKENKGLSAARNTGIGQATADYLMFVDSDDWVHEDFCKAPYECAIHNDSDIVMFGYRQISYQPKKHENMNITVIIPAGFRSKQEAIDLTFTVIGMVAWNKLYHKKLFKTIRYPEGKIFEDTATTYKLIWNSSRIYCMDQVLYVYYRRTDSITMRKLTRKTLNTHFTVCQQMCVDLTKWGFSSEQFTQFQYNICFNYCMKTPVNFSEPCYATAAAVLRDKKRTPQGLTWKLRILLKLFQHSPQLFSLVCCLWNRQVH